jgi:hypothetical protein
MFVSLLVLASARVSLHGFDYFCAPIRNRLVGTLHFMQAILLIGPISASIGCIRGLSHRWEPGRCSFMYHSKPHFDHPEHDYKAASFIEELKIPPGSFEGAWSLLKSLEKKNCDPEVLLNCHKNIASRVDEHSYPDVQDIPVKDNLLIPKYITDAAATYRLVLVKLFEFKFRDTVQYWLQPGYENVPGQCPCSSTFRLARAELVREREGKYNPENPEVSWPAEGSCKHGCTKVDSDGDSSPVRLSAAAALGEHLGPGVSVQVGRGGFSSSHEGMVHAFIRLKRSSVGIIEALLESTPSLVQANEKWLPDLRRSHILPDFLQWRESRCIATYRAIMANRRQELQHTLSDRCDSEMAIIPVRDGVITVGRLTPAYHRHIFGKHAGITAMKFSGRTQSVASRIMASLRHGAMRGLEAVRGR